MISLEVDSESDIYCRRFIGSRDWKRLSGIIHESEQEKLDCTEGEVELQSCCLRGLYHRNLKAEITLRNCPVEARVPEQSLVWAAPGRGTALGEEAFLSKRAVSGVGCICEPSAVLSLGSRGMSAQVLQEDLGDTTVSTLGVYTSCLA